jgi:hypothetical protein
MVLRPLRVESKIHSTQQWDDFGFVPEGEVDRPANVIKQLSFEVYEWGNDDGMFRWKAQTGF